MKKSTPEMQLLYQLFVSSVILIPLSLLFGEWIRDLQPWHLVLFSLQVIFVGSIGFLVWFWILLIYPAFNMVSFGFLSPVFGVIFGWIFLNEMMGLTIIDALTMVSIGIILINWKTKPVQLIAR